jgi:predicted enzyme related to lactoylglutathione lyase
MNKIKLGSLLIGVSDLNQARIFYEKVFGMQTIEFRPPFMQANLNGMEFNIEEDADYRNKDWAKNNIGGRKAFSFYVDDIFDFISEARAYGAIVVEEPKKEPWEWYDAVIADSDGNEFVISQEIKP